VWKRASRKNNAASEPLLSAGLCLAHQAPLPSKTISVKFPRDRRRHPYWVFEAKKRFGLLRRHSTVRPGTTGV
jgi:hypothetical protein